MHVNIIIIMKDLSINYNLISNVEAESFLYIYTSIA